MKNNSAYITDRRAGRLDWKINDNGLTGKVIAVRDDCMTYFAQLPEGMSEEQAVESFIATYDYNDEGTEEGLRSILRHEIIALPTLVMESDLLGGGLTERWEQDGDDKMLLTITDADGEEVAGAVYDPEADEYDTSSDGCGILCDETHPAYRLLTRMDERGDWPSAPSPDALDEKGEWTGTLKLEGGVMENNPPTKTNLLAAIEPHLEAEREALAAIATIPECKQAAVRAYGMARFSWSGLDWETGNDYDGRPEDLKAFEARVKEDAGEAEDLAAKAKDALDVDDFAEAADLARQAARIEGNYGGTPTWGRFGVACDQLVALVASLPSDWEINGTWNMEVFAAARDLTGQCGMVWDFEGWSRAANCIRQGKLGGVEVA